MIRRAYADRDTWISEKLDKGSIVVLSNGEIIDGRHRAAKLISLNKSKIGAYIPIRVGKNNVLNRGI